MLEAIRRYFWRRRLSRALRRYAENCPTGRAFYGALAAAKADNDRWLRTQKGR